MSVCYLLSRNVYLFPNLPIGLPLLAMPVIGGDDHEASRLISILTPLFLLSLSIEGAKDYLECSAKSNDGVRDVFEAATRAALEKSRNLNKKCAIL